MVESSASCTIRTQRYRGEKMYIRSLTILLTFIAVAFLLPANAGASEADLVLPDLTTQSFQGISGFNLLLGGLVVCALGMLFGWIMYRQLKSLPVHSSMKEISELIYETCKSYLITQGKFILRLEL